MWTTALGGQVIEQGQVITASWSNTVTLTGLITSTAVNALTTGLIVFRIFEVFRQVKYNTTSEEKSLGITGGSHLRPVIFVIIESGMTLFAIQLARVVLAAILPSNSDAQAPYSLIVPVHEMLNVITSHCYLMFY